MRLNRSEAERLHYTDLVAGHGPTTSLFWIGSLAGVLLCLIPALWLLVNAGFRYWASTPYHLQVTSSPAFVALIPDVLLIALLGGILALSRMVSIKQQRFVLLNTNRGSIRLGLDDLVGLVAGMATVWLILYRHELHGLLILTGALFPILGVAITWMWDTIYSPLVRKLVTVPLDVEIAVTVKQALQHSPDTSELFRVDDVAVDREAGCLVVSGAGSQAFLSGKNEQRFRDVIRSIPLVTQNVTEIRIIDTASPS